MGMHDHAGMPISVLESREGCKIHEGGREGKAHAVQYVEKISMGYGVCVTGVEVCLDATLLEQALLSLDISRFFLS